MREARDGGSGSGRRRDRKEERAADYAKPDFGAASLRLNSGAERSFTPYDGNLRCTRVGLLPSSTESFSVVGGLLQCSTA